jgi:dienelactone hydrolase
MDTRDVEIELTDARLPGIVSTPDPAAGVVMFAHGSGSSRLSPRNAAVASRLNEKGLVTVLFDLLTPVEERDRNNVFDIPLLGRRLVGVCRWLGNQSRLAELPVGIFGASTGAAAGLVAAAAEPDRVSAVVSRGGRPDLADTALGLVSAPTLLIVGGADTVVLELNRQALAAMHGDHDLVIVPGAGHLFEGPGELEHVAALAADWFLKRFG